MSFFLTNLSFGIAFFYDKSHVLKWHSLCVYIR